MNFEYWLRKNGDIAETERNPCGCHPDDYNITHKPTIVDKLRTIYIGHMPRKKFLSYMKQLGYERLK